MFTVFVSFSVSDVLTNWVLEPDYLWFFCGGGGMKEQGMGAIYGHKKPKLVQISEYSAADVSPVAPEWMNVGNSGFKRIMLKTSLIYFKKIFSCYEKTFFLPITA